MTEETTHSGQLGVADVLQALGAELREAQQRGGSTIAWMSAEVEMEVAVETSGSGAVKFWVLNAGANHGVTRTTRVKVTLTPHNDNDEALGVGM